MSSASSPQVMILWFSGFKEMGKFPKYGCVIVQKKKIHIKTKLRFLMFNLFLKNKYCFNYTKCLI